jgi:hypothetical protein
MVMGGPRAGSVCVGQRTGVSGCVYLLVTMSLLCFFIIHFVNGCCPFVVFFDPLWTVPHADGSLCVNLDEDETTGWA